MKQFPLFKCSCSTLIGRSVFHHRPVRVPPPPDNQRLFLTDVTTMNNAHMLEEEEAKKRKKKKNSADLILADDCRSKTFSSLWCKP